MTETFKTATRYDGRIYTGQFHPDIFESIQKDHPEATFADCVEGFVRNRTGEFLNRSEAKRVVNELGLLRSGRDKFVDTKLYTEYLPECARA